MTQRIVFDAGAYQDLARRLGDLAGEIRGAGVGDVRVQPADQGWVLAQDLVEAGTRYFEALGRWNDDSVDLAAGLRDDVTRSRDVLTQGSERARESARGD